MCRSPAGRSAAQVIDILAQGRYGAAKREYYFQNDDYEYVLAPFRDGCKSCIWIPKQIDIFHSLQIPVSKDFPIEDFFRVPFTHHVRIIEETKDIQARYYYIRKNCIFAAVFY